MASIEDLDNPGVISVASTRKESEVKNHKADKNGEAGNVSQPAYYRVRKIPEEPKSVRGHLRIARTKEEDSPWLTQIRSGSAGTRKGTKVQANMLIERDKMRRFHQWCRTLDDLQAFEQACIGLNKEISKKVYARKEDLFRLMQIQERKSVIWMEGPLGWTAWVIIYYDVLS